MNKKTKSGVGGSVYGIVAHVLDCDILVQKNKKALFMFRAQEEFYHVIPDRPHNLHK